MPTATYSEFSAIAFGGQPCSFSLGQSMTEQQALLTISETWPLVSITGDRDYDAEYEEACEDHFAHYGY